MSEQDTFKGRTESYIVVVGPDGEEYICPQSAVKKKSEATEEELIRIPGIGHQSAKRIIRLRRKKVRIKSRKQLVELGVVLGRAQPFLKIDGNCQAILNKWF